MRKLTVISLCLAASMSFALEANDGKRKPPEKKSIVEQIIQIFTGTNTDTQQSSDDDSSNKE